VDLQQHLRTEHVRRYLVQCGLAGIVVLLLLLVLDAVTQTVLIAALGASSFIAFAVPRSAHSGPRHMIGGYLVGIVAGCTTGFLHEAMHIQNFALDHAAMIVCGALATAGAMLAMVVTRTEHPPAAALALGLVLNEWNMLTIGVVLAGVVALSVVKRIVQPALMDLF